MYVKKSSEWISKLSSAICIIQIPTYTKAKRMPYFSYTGDEDEVEGESTFFHLIFCEVFVIVPLWKAAAMELQFWEAGPCKAKVVSDPSWSSVDGVVDTLSSQYTFSEFGTRSSSSRNWKFKLETLFNYWNLMQLRSGKRRKNTTALTAKGLTQEY